MPEELAASNLIQDIRIRSAECVTPEYEIPAHPAKLAMKDTSGTAAQPAMKRTRRRQHHPLLRYRPPWKQALEMIFLYEPELLEDSQRCDALIQQDYIHSCGVLFASDVGWADQRELQRQFRAGYGAPNHFEQPWFPDYYYPRAILDYYYPLPESATIHFLTTSGYGSLW